MAMSKTLLILIVGVTAVTLGAGAYIVYNQRAEPISPSVDEITPLTKGPGETLAPDKMWFTYRNEKYGFEFKYPSEFVLFKGMTAKYSSGALFPPPFVIGSPIVRVGFPESRYQDTNLIEASLAVNIYPGQKTSECLTRVYSQEEIFEIETINGIDFFIERWGEGGMGHRYEVTSYRTIHQGTCYAVNLVVYWSSMSEEMGVSRFDRTEVLASLKAILSTFRFTK